jgi:acyl-homoserine-lactone acylase
MRKLTLVLVFVANCLAAGGKTEILWDQYGVPHIFAADRESMFYAHGWAQMHNQANLLLRLYGESRGRGAEYWGVSHLPLDRWLQTNGMPERAKEWYDAQDPTFRGYIDAFARGINDFAKAHPAEIEPENRIVLPVTGVDVVGHALRVVHYMYMGSQQEMNRELTPLLREAGATKVAKLDTAPAEPPGSNTWAIGPSRSASGNAMLIINPHLAWGETFYRYMEVHLVGPNYDLYGSPQIGFPVPVVGFNRRTGWGRTVNVIDTVDFYRLTVRDGQYEFDGKLRPFEHTTKVLKIKQSDGSLREETLQIRRSMQGPVVYDDHGITLAMRVAGLDRPKMLEQWFRMGEAQNLEQFKDAMRMMSIPMWNANYADADGHIMLVFDGLVPKRKIEDFSYWAKVVPGDTSKTLWTEYHSFDDLPKSIDPASGFNQNTNEPPWTSTFPQLDRTKYPPYMSRPGLLMPSFRTIRSLRMLTQDEKINYEKLLTDKFSTKMELADAVVPDLLKAANDSTDPAILEAARILGAWDHRAEADSQGAVLFQTFADKYFGYVGDINPKLRVKYDPEHPLESGYGLADANGALKTLAAAAAECKAKYGSAAVEWGEVNRFVSGPADVPGNGASNRMGSFRTIQFGETRGDRHYASHGETFVCVIEFAHDQKAECALSYGNASQHNSPHLEDQLPLMEMKELHPVWRERKDIEAHLEQRETF